MDSLPPEMCHTVKQGIMSTELLQQWLHWEQRYLLRQLLRFPGTPVLASGCVKVWSHVNVCRQHASKVTSSLCQLSLPQRILPASNAWSSLGCQHALYALQIVAGSHTRCQHICWKPLKNKLSGSWHVISVVG